MNPETALRLAGPGSHLAARPRGVAHVVPAGPLTPSGRFIPRSSRTVCRARHRRLEVVAATTAPGSLPRLCALCSARLGALLIKVSSDQAGRAPHLPTGVNGGPGSLSPDGADDAPNEPKGSQAATHSQDTPAPVGYLSRGDYRRRYAGLNALDLALAAVTATTTAEIDHVGHLSLLLLGHAGCQQPVTTPDGRPLPGEHPGTTVHQLIARHRARLTPLGEHEQKVAAYDRENAELAAATRRANRHQIRAARDERIRQLGITNAYPTR